MKGGRRYVIRDDRDDHPRCILRIREERRREEKEQERKKREKKAQMKSLFDDTVAYYTASSVAEDKHYVTYGRNRQYVKN